jgi:aspartyl-tRNA synthetase
MTDGYGEKAKGSGPAAVPVVKVNAQGNSKLASRSSWSRSRPSFSHCLGLKPGDTVLFTSDVYSIATKLMGEMRQWVARDMGQGSRMGQGMELPVGPSTFPMFRVNKETGKWVAMLPPVHGSTGRPGRGLLEGLEEDDADVEGIVSAGYDIVLNGSEIAGGSIRIHDQKVQRARCSAFWA